MRSIDSSLLSKINQQNQTIYNGAEPKMSVQVSRAKTTVSDSTYWTVETIRTKAGLGDLSLAARREKAYGPPNRIYNIYIDNGVVKTAIREYPDYLKEKWKTQFDLGNGSAVAIAFDGEWEFYRKKWQLKTYENPWLFWVDGSGKLWTQLWDDVSTKFELSSGVSKVKAIRGWKNVTFADRDQGVIAGYIKSGKVFYRNYCTQADGSLAWETEREITEFVGTAVNLNLFITNDYRMGFIIEDSLGKIHWLITERNWAGMAIAPETISVAPAELTVDIIPIEYIKPIIEDEYITVAPAELITDLLYADTDNELSAINIPDENDDWGWIIEINFDHPVPELSLANVVATNIDNLTSITIEDIEKISDIGYRLNVSDIVESGINNVYGDIKITVTGVLNPAGYIYVTMEDTFTPLNLTPTFIPLPEVEVIYNE